MYIRKNSDEKKGIPGAGRHRRRVLRVRVWRAVAAALLFCVLSHPFHASCAQTARHDVKDIKTAFVYNFIRFVDWPDEAFRASDNAIAFCVLGSDEAAEVMTALDGRMVRGRKIVVTRTGGVAGIEKCRVLFIGRSAQNQARAILDAIGELPILTIADFPGFARSGGIANFVRGDRKLSFEINQSAAERCGLHMSSRLLRFAEIVEGGAWH